MRTLISRWFMFGLLLGWALTHATVFGQPAGQSTETKAAPTADRLRQGLEKTITVDFNGQSLTEVINHVRDRTGLPISIDEQGLLAMGMDPGGNDGLGQPFRVKATNEKAGQVLRKFLNNYRLCYVIFEESILITSEDMAVLRQMRQRVSVNLEDVPAKKAIRDLARANGINLVIDPKVMKQIDAPVSLQVDNTGIETAVRLLAELANLKAVRMGNVMFITSEEKAKKIRDEEQHQFDNPLNPNLPGGPGQIGFGGGFGGANGVPIPRVAFPLPPPGVEPLPPDKAEPGKPGEAAPPVKKGAAPIPPQRQPQPAAPPVLERPAGEGVPVPRREPSDK